MTADAGRPPVAVTRPAGPQLPIVVDSPHSGRDYPADFGYAIAFDRLRGGEDLFVDELYASAPRHGATLVAARFPRAYIDPNRAVTDLDEALLDARWPQPLAPGPKSALGIGLVWRNAGRDPIYDRRLTVDEVRRRIDHCYRPYHAALDAALADARARAGGASWHLNVHSMPDDSYAALGLPDRPLADFVLGDLDGRTSSPAFVAVIADTLAAHGYTVARNEPFKGVDIIARTSDPARHRFALQIEIRRSLYADVERHAPNAAFGRAQAAIDAMLAALAGHVRDVLRARGDADA